MVRRVGTEEFARTDDTPEDTSVEMDASERTCEAVGGFLGADFGHVGEHPIQDANLGYGGNNGGDHLNYEEDSWRDFHIVAELKVRGEFYALCGRYVAVCYEDHVCHWAAGKDGPAHELAN